MKGNATTIQEGVCESFSDGSNGDFKLEDERNCEERHCLPLESVGCVCRNTVLSRFGLLLQSLERATSNARKRRELQRPSQGSFGIGCSSVSGPFGVSAKRLQTGGGNEVVCLFSVRPKENTKAEKRKCDKGIEVAHTKQKRAVRSSSKRGVTQIGLVDVVVEWFDSRRKSRMRLWPQLLE